MIETFATSKVVLRMTEDHLESLPWSVQNRLWMESGVGDAQRWVDDGRAASVTAGGWPREGLPSYVEFTFTGPPAADRDRHWTGPENWFLGSGQTQREDPEWMRAEVAQEARFNAWQREEASHA